MEIIDDKISPLIEKFRQEIADTNVSGFLMENNFEGYYISRLATMLSIVALTDKQHPSRMWSRPPHIRKHRTYPRVHRTLSCF